MEKEIDIYTGIYTVMEIGTDIDIYVDTEIFCDAANVAAAQPRPSAAV